jgi:hypothetical protein
LPPLSIPMTKRRAQVFADADSVARQAAALVAAEARAAVAARDRSASLVPGDPVLEISDNDVATCQYSSGIYGRAMPLMSRKLVVDHTQLGDEAGLYGAGALA